MPTNEELQQQVNELTQSNSLLQTQLTEALNRESGEHTNIKSFLYRIIAALTGKTVPEFEQDLEAEVEDVEAQRVTLSTLENRKRQLQADISTLSVQSQKEVVREKMRVAGITPEEIATLETR